ncbi:MAG: hypothetical protein ACTSUD_11450 [Alphaproteobacteria bacterium]
MVLRASGFRKLVIRGPGLERFVRITRAGWIFLLPPSLFWIVFALSVFGIWSWPLAQWRAMPEFLQTLGLVLCPVLVLISGIVRLRWDRDHARFIQAARRHTVLGALFLLLTILAMIRAA